MTAAIAQSNGDSSLSQKPMKKFAVRGIEQFRPPTEAAVSVARQAINAHETEVQASNAWTNSAGAVREVSTSYIHLQPGMNVQDPVNGEWKEAQLSFHQDSEGVLVEGGWFEVDLAASSLNEPAFSVRAHSGETLSGNVLGLSVTTSGNQGQVTLRIQYTSMFEPDAATAAWSIPGPVSLSLDWIADVYNSTIFQHTESHLSRLVQLDYSQIHGLDQSRLNDLQALDAARIGARWQKIQRIAAIPGGNLAQKRLRIQGYVDEIHTISTRLKAVVQQRGGNLQQIARWAGPAGSVLFMINALNGTDPDVNNFRQSLMDFAKTIADGGYGTAEYDLDLSNLAANCENTAPGSGNYGWGWLAP